MGITESEEVVSTLEELPIPFENFASCAKASRQN